MSEKPAKAIVNSEGVSVIRKEGLIQVFVFLQLIKGNEKERFLSILFNWEVSIW